MGLRWERLRPTKGDENGHEQAVYFLQRGVEEVVTALEKLRPQGSLTRARVLNR
jgi:hypothetical protein